MTYNNETDRASSSPEDMAPTPVDAGAGANHRWGQDGSAKDAPFRNGTKAERNGSYTPDDPDRPRWDHLTVPEADYDYCTADGEYCFTVRRGRHPDGCKRFKIARRNMIPFGERIDPEDKGEWLMGMGDHLPMLYRLQDVKNASPDAPVFIVEGEKDADRLAAMGLIAVTNSNGAGKWIDEFSKELEGRICVSLPDNDDVGRDHADKVIRSLHGVAHSVRVIELAGLPPKGDVSDWIAAGHTRDELLALVEQAQPITSPTEWLASRGQFIATNGRKPDASPANAYVALHKLGARVRYDAFALRFLIEGLPGFGPALDDMALTRLRLDTEKRFGIVFPKDRWADIVTDHARNNAFHPVKDYLGGLRWDGTPRLDDWLVIYGGAEPSEYVRTVGALVLIAAVRRIHIPGIKFDQMLVLEGEQGGGKSTALAIMAVREEWFTDDLPLDADAKAVMERIAGCWLIEAAELKGMRQAETEKIKGFLSRRYDKARLAYARMATEQPRQCVFIGTTNSDDYLRDMTGNRRFWPVKVGRFDLEALARDRDQIWAEAVERERAGASLGLPRHLWVEAAGHQEQRLATDPFEELLFGPLLDLEGKVRAEIVWQLVGMPDGAKRTQSHNSRLGAVMRKHGWIRKQMRFNGTKEYGYMKGDGAVEALPDKLFCPDRHVM